MSRLTMTGEKSACSFYNCTGNGKPGENISLIFSYLHQKLKSQVKNQLAF
jgi:hypothetical protein